MHKNTNNANGGSSVLARKESVILDSNKVMLGKLVVSAHFPN